MQKYGTLSWSRRLGVLALVVFFDDVVAGSCCCHHDPSWHLVFKVEPIVNFAYMTNPRTRGPIPFATAQLVRLAFLEPGKLFACILAEMTTALGKVVDTARIDVVRE
jgi:hypothetical protein